MPTSEDRAQKDTYRKVVGPSNRPPFGRCRLRKLYCFAFVVKVLPPLFVGFNDVEALLAALPSTSRNLHEAEIRRLSAIGLPPAVSTWTLATLFGVSPEFILAISRDPARYYRVFKIKKGKKTRTIQAPRIALKVLQAWFSGHLARASVLPECVFGFVPGRSGVKEAATRHCQSTWVYSLDIRDFFPSITQMQVTIALLRIGYTQQSAEFLSRLLTLGGRLPQGSPASPVLSNLVFYPTDQSLIDLAQELKVRYTRYADDLVFSGTDAPPLNLRDRVRRIVTDAGWVIADDKELLAQLPARLKVHGLLVHGAVPRLTKGYRNRIRAFKHLLAAGKVSEVDKPRLLGHLAYSRFIDKA